jgi:ADP-heptose:LPS heptosyltransferase
MNGRDLSWGLVYHNGALGDFITTLPAIAVWRRLARFDRITLLGKPAHAALAPSILDEALDATSARFAPLLAGTATGAELGGYAAALVYAKPGAGILAALRVDLVLRQDPFPPTRVHVVDWHLSLFPEAMIDPEDRVPHVGIIARQSRGRSGVLAIAPGSGSAAKSWPLDRFFSLAEELRPAGRIAWVVGPAEEESGMADRVARSLPGDALWTGLALSELAARLGCARLLVGNDSGVAHLAAAAGCAVVALFGASDPQVWAPRGRAVRIVGDGTCGMASISVEQVFRACRSMLSNATAAD